MESKNTQPIAVFDSGVGGISVLKELVKILPNENYIYFGDSKHAPYGMKTIEEVRRLTTNCADTLFARGAKALVVACNTATSAAVRTLREEHPDIPIVGIEPAVKPAALTTKSGVIGVLATKRSLEGDHFRRNEEKYGSEVKILKAVGEGFVEAVEQNKEQLPETEALVRKAVEPLVEGGADKIVLGCTHYPFLRDVIARVAGDGVEIIDSSEAVARRVGVLLDENNLRAEEGAKPEYRFLTFADEEYAERLRKKAFNR